jgi:hypothetical protein
VQFIKNQHLEWFNLVGPEVPKRLENTLIVQDASDGSLVVNFDKTLLNLFHEVRNRFVGQASGRENSRS